MLSLWIPRIALFATVLFAIRKGDEPERLVASVFLATFVLDTTNHMILGEATWFVVNPGHVVIDGWAFIVLLWIALRANRGWPLWVSASQMLIMLGHLAKLWDLEVVRRAYWVMTQVPFLLQLVALAIGTWAHIARRRRIGWYHSWRPDPVPRRAAAVALAGGHLAGAHRAGGRGHDRAIDRIRPAKGARHTGR